mgnify:CR=1 FL=1
MDIFGILNLVGGLALFHVFSIYRQAPSVFLKRGGRLPVSYPPGGLPESLYI